MEELVVGQMVGPWILVSHIPPPRNSGYRHSRWVVKCVKCDTLQRRLADHLSLNIQPGCGKCKTQAGVVYVGTEAKKRIAARAGEEITDLEAWALDNCDDDLKAQMIVTGIIKRETARIRAENAAKHERELRKEKWHKYVPSRKLDISQVSTMEDDDGFIVERE